MENKRNESILTWKYIPRNERFALIEKFYPGRKEYTLTGLEIQKMVEDKFQRPKLVHLWDTEGDSLGYIKTFHTSEEIQYFYGLFMEEAEEEGYSGNFAEWLEEGGYAIISEVETYNI